MSEQLQSRIGASQPSSGVRSIAKALLISLGVHAVLLGVFWHFVSNRPEPAQRDVRVELSPGVHAVAPIAAEHTLAAAAPERSERPLKASSAHPSRARAAVAPPPTRATDRVEPEADRSNTSSATSAALDPLDGRQAQQGTLPIDLRVLDWLAQYRSYPLAARRARIEGVVQLRVTLLPDGRLVDVRIEHSSGHAVLDQAALDLLTHAAPLPGSYSSLRTAQIELQLPIVYRMRSS